MIYSDEQKLELFYEYFLFLEKEFQTNNTPPYFTGEAGNTNELTERLFEFATSLYSLDGFPCILSDNEYEKVEQPIFYHGYKNYDHGANMLTHYNYHRGEGISGSGIYITHDPNEAFKYTKLDNVNQKSEWNRDKILEMKFSGRVIDELTLRRLAIEVSNDMDLREDLMEKQDIEKIKWLREFVGSKSLNKKQAQSFLRVFYENESLLAMLLGYDATEVYKRDWSTAHLVVFNRGKITVKESEFNRFCEKSNCYKNGCYEEVCT